MLIIHGFPKPMTYRHGGLYRLSVWSYWYRGIMWHFVEWLTLVLSPLPRWTVEKNGAVQRQLGWQIWWTFPGSNNYKQPPEIPFQMGWICLKTASSWVNIEYFPKNYRNTPGSLLPRQWRCLSLEVQALECVFIMMLHWFVMTFHLPNIKYMTMSLKGASQIMCFTLRAWGRKPCWQPN